MKRAKSRGVHRNRGTLTRRPSARTTLTQIDVPPILLRTPQVWRALSIGKDKFYLSVVNDPAFPAPVSLSESNRGLYSFDDIRAYAARLPRIERSRAQTT